MLTSHTCLLFQLSICLCRACRQAKHTTGLSSQTPSDVCKRHTHAHSHQIHRTTDQCTHTHTHNQINRQAHTHAHLILRKDTHTHTNTHTHVMSYTFCVLTHLILGKRRWLPRIKLNVSFIAETRELWSMQSIGLI